MKIGVAKERTAAGLERRPILLPEAIEALKAAGHALFVERGLGKGIGIPDSDYALAGARVVAWRRLVFSQEIVVKLKPPLPEEFKLLKDNLLFCMLHAEQNPHYLQVLAKRNTAVIAMELIQDEAGERLVECTEMAGEQGMLMAFHLAQKSPADCNVLVLGYGAIASGALKVAHSLGAKTKILRKQQYPKIAHFLKGQDIVVNGISWPKESRDKKEYLITRKMLSLLSAGAVILDLSVDYPNPVETSRPTYLNDPAYTVDGVQHLSVYGYPGLSPVSSAQRYSKQVLSLLLEIASSEVGDLPDRIQAALFMPDKSGSRLVHQLESSSF